MAAKVKFNNFSVQCKNILSDACISWLYEAAGEIQAQTKRNSRVDTGITKNSYDYEVDEGLMKAVVGSMLENAIWEEFGTGYYALNGDGRKTPWVYKDKDGKCHYTHGKKPNRPLQKAFDSLKEKLQQSLESKMEDI